MRPGSHHWLVASLALEYGFDPEAIMGWEPMMFDTVLAVHEARVRELERR